MTKLYTGYMIILLKSGKAIDFYLGRRADGELASFLKQKISG